MTPRRLQAVVVLAGAAVLAVAIVDAALGDGTATAIAGVIAYLVILRATQRVCVWAVVEFAMRASDRRVDAAFDRIVEHVERRNGMRP